MHTDKSVQFNPEVLVHEDVSSPTEMSESPSFQPYHEKEIGDGHEEPQNEIQDGLNVSYEENELLDSLMKHKQEMKMLQTQGLEAQDQVKRSVHLVEAMKYEKSKIELERNHLKDEVKKLENKISILEIEHEKNLTQVKALSTNEHQPVIMDLQAQLNSSLENQARLHLQLDQHSRDKARLLNDVHHLQEHNEELQHEIKQLVINSKAQIVQATLSKDSAFNELSQMHHKMMKENHEHQQEKERLESYVESLQRKLAIMEQEYLKSKQECVELAEAFSAKQKENKQIFTDHQRKINSDTTRTCMKENEEKLQKVVKINAQYIKVINKLENMTDCQRILTQKLLRESFELLYKSQETEKYLRQENFALESQLEESNGKLEQSRLQRKQLQNQCEQHRSVQCAMEKQLQTLKEKLHLTNQVQMLLGHPTNNRFQMSRSDAT